MKIFIGSSKEALEYIEELAVWIEEAGHQAIPWNKPGAFPLGEFTLDSLIEMSDKVDGAVFVFSPDDETWYRKEKFRTARDNVIFEYGLFSGSISKKNVIFCKAGEVKDIGDLSGITYVDLFYSAKAKQMIKGWLKRISQNDNLQLNKQNIFPMLNTKEAVEKTNEIYFTATKKGGNIFATHIFSRISEAISHNKDGSIKEIHDIALKVISEKGCSHRLTFERVLLFKNQDIERKWILDSFSTLNKYPEILPCFYIPAQYPINPNDWFSGFSTKTDLLLYSNTEMQISVFGFDSLHHDIGRTFTAFSHSPKIYNRLVEYFNELTTRNIYFRPVRSIDDYFNIRTLSSLSDGFHQIIDFLIDFSKEHSSEICYLGLFGSVAKLALNHITKEQLNEKDADLDFLIITNTKTSRSFLERELTKNLSKLDCFTVFGPDPENNDFYPIREENKINVDIEIVTKDGQFYQQHKLLGFSISRYLYKLFSRDNKEANFFINIPNLPLNTHSSYKELLHSRKGLLDFEKITKKTREYDPNRIVSHIFRNMAWADSGHYPKSTKNAINYLQKYNLILDSFTYENYEEFFYHPSHEVAESILEDAIFLAKTKLKEPNKSFKRRTP